jgi:heterodisulfide reductase subunit A
MFATKEAIIAKEHLGPDLQCDIFFMDMRTFSKGFDEYYERAKQLGVNYIRSRPASVEEDPQSRNLTVQYLIGDDRKASREYDMVVLSVGMQPPKDADRMAKVFGINRWNPNGRGSIWPEHSLSPRTFPRRLWRRRARHQRCYLS